MIVQGLTECHYTIHNRNDLNELTNYIQVNKHAYIETDKQNRKQIKNKKETKTKKQKKKQKTKRNTLQNNTETKKQKQANEINNKQINNKGSVEHWTHALMTLH